MQKTKRAQLTDDGVPHPALSVRHLNATVYVICFSMFFFRA
jgi:hypothetical protein